MKQADNHTSVERLARRRAGAKMGWYIHATVYVLVNLFLVALAASHDGHWAVFPLLGWGLDRQGRSSGRRTQQSPQRQDRGPRLGQRDDTIGFLTHSLTMGAGCIADNPSRQSSSVAWAHERSPFLALRPADGAGSAHQRSGDRNERATSDQATPR